MRLSYTIQLFHCVPCTTLIKIAAALLQQTFCQTCLDKVESQHIVGTLTYHWFLYLTHITTQEEREYIDIDLANISNRGNLLFRRN